MITSLLDELCSKSPRWAPGRNLALLKVDAVEPQVLDILRERLTAGTPHPDTGALLLLYGAWLFGQRLVPPFNWHTIASALELPAGFHIPLYDAIESGAERFLGTPLLRSAGKRRFIGTMLRHSGASRATVERALEIAGSQGAWKLLESGEPSAASWLNSARGHYRFRASDRAALASEEALVGVAARLSALAGVRARLISADIDSWEKLERSVGLQALVEAVEDEDESFVRRVASILFDFHTDDVERPEFRWSWRDGRACLQFPSVIAPEVHTSVDRVRLRVGGAQPTVYARAEGAFRHVHGPTVVPAPAQAPVAITLEARRGDTIEEQLFDLLPFPGDPVAVFDTASGQLDHHGRAEMVAVVARPPLLLQQESEPASSSRRLQRPETEPVEFSLFDDGPVGSWVLYPPESYLAAELFGDPVDGLRLGGHAVHAWAPGFRNLEHDRAVTFETVDPDGLVDVVTLPANTTAPQEWTAPGKYRVTATAHGRADRTWHVWHVPDVRVCVEDDVVRVEGLVVTFEDGRHEYALDADAHGQMRLRFFASEAQGDVRIARWRESVTMVDSSGDAVEAGELGSLRESGRIVMTGEPRTTVSVEVGHPNRSRVARWSLLFTAEGRAELQLASIPTHVLQSEMVEVRLRWTTSGRSQTLGPFKEVRQSRAVASGFGVRNDRALEHPTIRGFRAWQPWTPVVSFDVRQLPDDDYARYEAETTANGPWIVALFEGDRRVSGCWLTDRDARPTGDLSPLERALWANQSTLQTFCNAEFADRRGVIGALCERVAVFGAPFVSWSRFLVDFASEEWLRALVRIDPLPGAQEAFEQVDAPPFAVRHADLAALNGYDATDLTEAFIEIATHPWGLAAPAFHAWSAKLDLARCAPFLRRETSQARDEELAAEPHAIPAGYPVSARLAGLVQAHECSRIENWGQFARKHDLWEGGGTRVHALDRHVEDLCRRIVAWQRGDLATLPAAFDLYQRLPNLFDYWLDQHHRTKT